MINSALAAVAVLGLLSARAEEPNEVVERTLKNYCEMNKVDRSELKSFKLDLIPGTQTFRHTLPPLEAPESSPYAGLTARSAFLIVDAKSGTAIEVKASKYGYSIAEATPELFAAMRAAGAKVKTDADATRVMRTLIFLERAAGQTEAKMEDVSEIESKGRVYRPFDYEGGAFAWTRGDLIGLRVDRDDFATTLTGGHLK